MAAGAKMMISFLHRFVSNVRFRLVAATSVTAIVLGIFGASFSTTRISDPIPEPIEYTKARLASFGPFTAKVECGLYIRDFSRFDIIHREFLMDATVWFVFNPAETNLASINQFSFVNGTIKSKSTPDIAYIDDKLFVRYEVKVRFRSELDYRFYPYEDHRLAIILTNTYVTPSEVLYTTHDGALSVSPMLLLGNWRIKNWRTKHGYSDAEFDSTDARKDTASPEAVFELRVASVGVKNILIIFMPLLFTLLLALFSLLIPYKYDDTRENALMFTVASAAVASILGYRFVIQSMMPQVGYMTTTDDIFLLCLVVAMIIFLIHILFFLTLMQRSLRLDKESLAVRESQADAVVTQVNVLAAGMFFVMSLAVFLALIYILLL